MRADDLPILEFIKSVISNDPNIGCITLRKRKGNTSPHATLYYDGIKHNKYVVEHFTKYPLQAKKKYDFENWLKVYRELEKGEFLERKNQHRKRDENGRLRSIDEHYTKEEVEKKVYISYLCDLIRIGRIDESMIDLGRSELLRRFGGQENTYTYKTIIHLKEHGTINKLEALKLLNKYSFKIS